MKHGTQLKLNNGGGVKFKGLDDFYRPIMQYKATDKKPTTLLIVDNIMHTQCNGEPDYPLSEALQLKDYDYDFLKGEFVLKDGEQV